MSPGPRQPVRGFPWDTSNAAYTNGHLLRWPFSLLWLAFFGAGDGPRTRDILLGKLPEFNPAFATAVEHAKREAKNASPFMQSSGHLPLTDPIGQVLDRMEAARANTPWPVLLFLWANDAVPLEQKCIAAAAIDSYLVRRSACRWTTKDYNRLFLQVLLAAKSADPLEAGTAVANSLLSQQADSRRWPTDEEFSDGRSSFELMPPCGRCRELISDFDCET